MYDFWPDIEPDSDSSNYGSSNKGGKDQESPEYQEQEEAVLVPCTNPIRIRQGDQRALIQIKSDSERSKDKLFLINHMSARSTLTLWYLVQVDMYQSDPT